MSDEQPRSRTNCRRSAVASRVRHPLTPLIAATVVAAMVGVAPASAAEERAFEMISPVDTNGGQVLRMAPVGSADGDAVLYAQNAPNEDSLGGLMSVPVVARRTPAGWVQHDVTGPLGEGGNGPSSRILGGTPDLDFVYVSSDRPIRPGTEPGTFRIARDGRAVTAFGPLSVISAPLTADTFVGSSFGELFRVRDGVREKVSLLPDGSDARANDRRLTFPLAQDAGIDATESGRKAATTAVGNGWTHNVSTDGARVFFNSGTNDVNPVLDPTIANPLYVRDGNARTLPVSASQRAGEAGLEQPARFIGASPDGRVVFFASDAPLTDGVEGGAVYRYRLSDGQLLRLSGDPGPAGLGIISAWSSDDGSSVYFVATAALAAGATADSRNAYVWRDGQLRLVADLGPDGAVERVSRDGAFAVLSSSASIGAGVTTGGTPQLYRYRAADGRLDCASCRVDGSPNGASSLVFASPNAFINAVTNPRAITDDGRIFFTSYDRLVADDVSAAPDAYLYDGSAVRLISAGRDGAAYVTDNTDDGRSVFVVTTQRLVEQDTDPGEFDLYAARVGGGFPAPTPVAPCSGEACRPAPNALPGSPAPSSQAPGAGNVVPPVERPEPAIVKRPGIGAADVRKLARGGQATVIVRLRGPARVTLRAVATIAGRSRTVATARGTAREGNATLELRVRLSAAARRELRRKGRLRVRFTAELRGDAAPLSTTITLKKVRR